MRANGPPSHRAFWGREAQLPARLPAAPAPRAAIPPPPHPSAAGLSAKRRLCIAGARRTLHPAGCATIATSLPSAVVTRVCHTIVRREKLDELSRSILAIRGGHD